MGSGTESDASILSIYTSSSRANASRRSRPDRAESFAQAIGAAIAASNQSTNKKIDDSLQAMHKTLSIIEANEASTSTPPAKKKTIDPTLEMNILPSEIYLQGLNALPNNHARNGITTDLSKLPVFDGTQVIVTMMNQVFDFCRHVCSITNLCYHWSKVSRYSRRV